MLSPEHHLVCVIFEGRPIIRLIVNTIVNFEMRKKTFEITFTSRYYKKLYRVTGRKTYYYVNSFLNFEYFFILLFFQTILRKSCIYIPEKKFLL